MARRFIMRIELTAAAKKTLTLLSERNGMTQVSVISHIVQWFAEQPEPVQAAILGRYPAELEMDIARLILSRMAGEPEARV